MNDSININKILILYILDNLKDPISEYSLYSFLTDVTETNYFYFKDCLNGLVEKDCIEFISKNSSKENSNEIVEGQILFEDFINTKRNISNCLLCLSENGKEQLDLTINVLPGILKFRADTIFKSKLKELNDNSAVSAQFYPNGDEFIVDLKIMDKNDVLFQTKLLAGSKEMANTMINNFKCNATQIYSNILEVLNKPQ